MAEWLRRWTANPLCSARMGSNPILVVKTYWSVIKVVVVLEKNYVCFELSIFFFESITRQISKERVFFKFNTFTNTEQDEVAEWLRRWTANPLCSARMGSNPILVVKILLDGN